MEIISDTDRVVRMKEDLHKLVEAQYPFKRFFPSYGVGRAETEKTAEVATNKEMATTLNATITATEEIKVEKTVVVEKPLNKRLNKAVKVKTRKGKAVISLHRA